MQNDLRMSPTEFLCILYGTLRHITEQGLIGIVARTLRYLKDNGRLGLSSSHDDSLQLFHVVEVECRDCITSLDCLGEHLTGVHKSKIFEIYHNVIGLRNFSFGLSLNATSSSGAKLLL